MDADVIIVGAGIAGLRCALECKKLGLRTMVLEASDRIGGRIKTDTVNGFLLDHGFQVLLTAYEECQNCLDYKSLSLRNFEPGAIIWTGKEFAKLIDPWRRPKQILNAAFSPIGNFKDKLKIRKLNRELNCKSLDTIYHRYEQTTEKYLKEYGFSSAIIESFFRPFFGGIFLEDDLVTTNRMFEFVFKMFGQGFAALPEHGMQAIPSRLAEKLDPETVQFNKRVTGIHTEKVELVDGTTLTAKAVVQAADMSSAAELQPDTISDRGWNSTSCHYFSALQSPLAKPIIALNGSGLGNISNVSVPSDVNSGYSESGDALICVSTRVSIDESEVRRELQTWFGKQVSGYRFLKSYNIPKALPRQLPGENRFGQANLKTREGIWICGDHRLSSSIQGALASGRIVGESMGKTLL